MTTHFIRKVTRDDLELILCWRNHFDVRKYMYTQHEISLEEHINWFDRASKDTARHLLIFEENNMPLGFINLHLLGEGGIANWGFYVAPNAPKGTGWKLGQDLLHYAFVILGLHKVCGQVLSYNERSIRFHLRLGFQQEGVLREQHFDGNSYHAVICLGLLATDWLITLER
nr:UDP-4-amino-4,6-dideoxy-N-acetyl-beta-L-altrosamine N-acetyltransferase [Pusillimonas sp. MFBS29]